MRNQINDLLAAMVMFENLVAAADKMYRENAEKAQKESDAAHWAEFGHNGPSLAGPLGMSGRQYLYWRHTYGPDLGLPSAAVALGQRKE